jgi:DNA-binding NtrC family response regulator
MREVLIVDDELAIRESLRMILKRDYKPILASSGEEGLNILKQQKPDVILLDIIMPGLDGLETLKRIREADSHQQVIMITATKTIKTAVEAMKLGAFDYLTKPFNVDEIILVVEKAIKEKDLREENKRLRFEIDKKYQFENIIGKSKSMQKVFEVIQQIAGRNTTVLISGESGTGKELVARAIHYNSPRRNNPFVAINCAAIPESLIESELFGHEKGSFTNAYERRIGHFEQSHQSTLFLDEISELSPFMQAKILRFLQEKEFMRVGGTKSITVDTRLIAATNQDLDKALEEKTIREDFYYRINILPIVMPPLRDRREDIPLLVNHFLEKAAAEDDQQMLEVSVDAMEVFVNYDWPGNVREMENLIERIVALSQDPVITPDSIPENFKKNGFTPNHKKSLISSNMSLLDAESEFNREIILGALKKTDYVQSKAAKMLGISRRILKYKMDKLNIQPPRGQNE